MLSSLPKLDFFKPESDNNKTINIGSHTHTHKILARKREIFKDQMENK